MKKATKYITFHNLFKSPALSALWQSFFSSKAIKVIKASKIKAFFCKAKVAQVFSAVTFVGALCFFLALTPSCSRLGGVGGTVKSQELFALNYGNFPEQINLFSMRDIGDVRTGLAMKDGFFYIANGEAQKLLSFNSYGDLLQVYYNRDYYERENKGLPALTGEALWTPIDMPFSFTGTICVDEKKQIYAVASVPRDKEVYSKEDNLLYHQVVVCVLNNESSDGSLSKEITYLGIEGDGGNPFPYIKNVYTTIAGDVVVICVMNDGLAAFWYEKSTSTKQEFALKSKAVFSQSDIPRATFGEEGRSSADKTASSYITLSALIPDSTQDILYLKADYYNAHTSGEAATIQSGIDYVQTLIYPYDIKKKTWGEPFEIPPFLQNVQSSSDASSPNSKSVTYRLPYEALDITKNGDLLFIFPTNEGFALEAVATHEPHSVIKRNLQTQDDEVLYYAFDVSSNGVVSALFGLRDKLKCVWWRTDSLFAK